MSGARVYAKAFFSAAKESSATSKVVAELKEFAQQLEQVPAMRSIFGHNAVNAGERKKILVEILQAMQLGEQTKRMLVLLSNRGRLGELSELVAEFESLIDEDAGLRRGSLRTAVALDEGEVEALSVAITKKLKVKVKLNPQVDSTLLGGFIASVSGRTFDASLRTQLHKMKDALLR